MADRLLARHEEPHAWDAPTSVIEIDRSASGQPGLLFTTKYIETDGTTSEQTVTVRDGVSFLAPVVRWLKQEEFVYVELNVEQAEAMRMAWWDQQKIARMVSGNESSDLVIKQASIRDKHVKEAIALGVPAAQVRRFVYGDTEATEPTGATT